MVKTSEKPIQTPSEWEGVDFLDHIRRARSVREQAQKAREEKASEKSMPSTIPLSSGPIARP